MIHISTGCLKITDFFHMDEVSEQFLWRKTILNNLQFDNSYVFDLSNCSVVVKNVLTVLK